MPKTKRTARNITKRQLDTILNKSSEDLLKGYSNKELVEIYHKLKQLDHSLNNTLNYTPEIRLILGIKKDEKDDKLWFYVSWDSGMNSFISAENLYTIAPQKVIEFYESKSNFEKNPAKLPPQQVGFKMMNCICCSILLQYPEKTNLIKCPQCETLMSTS